MQCTTELNDRWRLYKLVLVVFASLTLLGAASCGGEGG
jgi:hypothetical protein